MEQGYDPLSTAQKHIMLHNGKFEFDTVEQGTCCCGHSKNQHLVNETRSEYSLCLDKNTPLCICDKFLDRKTKVIIPTKNGKIPIENNYIQIGITN